MTVRHSIAKAASGIVLAATALAAAPSVASAQGYYDNRAYDDYYSGRGYDNRDPRDRYYDDRRDFRDDRYCRPGNSAAGALVGGAAGAMIGSSVAGRGDRSAGGIIGGVLGAVAGSAAARNSVDCGPDVYVAPAYAAPPVYAPPPVYMAPPPPVFIAPSPPVYVVPARPYYGRGWRRGW